MVDLKEEKQYDQLRKLGQELHIPIPEAFWTLDVFDKDGRLIRRHRQRSHSWTRNAYNALFQGLSGAMAKDQTFGAGLLSMKRFNSQVKPAIGDDYFICMGSDQNGNTRCTAEGSLYCTFLAAAAFDGCGIQVGSGTDAESFEDYVLQTQILEGSGAGQLNHVASELPAVTYAALTLTNTLIRYFNNNSGGNIDVNEVALMAHMMFYTGAGQASHFLYSRDKLPATVTVPDTGQLKVTYTIELTYPS